MTRINQSSLTVSHVDLLKEHLWAESIFACTVCVCVSGFNEVK